MPTSPSRPEGTNPPGGYGRERQMQIHLAGLAGRPPAVPVALALLEQKAREVLAPEAFDYAEGGAGGEETMRANLQAFEQWRSRAETSDARRWTGNIPIAIGDSWQPCSSPLESGYTSNVATGYILKCLDGSSPVTFNTSPYGGQEGVEYAPIVFRAHNRTHHSRPR